METVTCDGCKTTKAKMIIETDVTHKMFGKTIEIKSVPVRTCQICGQMEYVYLQILESLLIDAYQKNISQLTFSMFPSLTPSHN